MRKQVVVAEIGSEWLKLVQFGSSGRGLAISKLHLQKFESVTGELTESLAAILKEQKFASLPVIACLPRQMVNVRMLDLPSTEPSEITDMVDLQAAKQTPYSKEEILCDHRIISSGREGYTRVMLAIVQRSLLRQRYAALEEAGLEIERMSVTSEGLLNWYTRGGAGRAAGSADQGSGATVLLDIDSGYADFSVISGDALIFTRSIMIGADQLLAEFDEYKDRFVREVKRSIELCRSESGSVSLGRLVLSGAKIGQLAAGLGDALDLPVESADSLACISKKPSTPDLQSGEYGAVSLTALTGAALAPNMLEFDLVPDIVRMRKALVARARRLSLFVILAVAAMISASILATVKVFLTEKRLESLGKQFDAIQPGVVRIERMQELIKVVRERQDTKFAAISLMAEIQGLVSGDLYFDALDIDREGEKVSLNGSAGSTRDIRTLVDKLRQSPLFEDVRQTGAEVLDRRSGRYKFEVGCILETGG